ncbi:hypothetical protein K0504_11360 [Neiella marina]|uniref:SGNH/GDSL hydrolase family protein n=1 Tax=Neiella holothuriorum TaxID=2870530 RepID=A0ABS7EIQ6_9GAMM|nr:hypothetical protein [Neiella holothuriorum]MBW8191636.1 hypothetical protein [Neiella holothuriorum]
MIRSFWIKVTLSSALLLVSMLLLPHSDYVRYQSIKTGVYAKSKWLYERASFDETPVNVAFFGTSHTLMAAKAPKLQANLEQELGKTIHISNFAIPQLGRDMHYSLMKMLLSQKKPDLVILEVRESEARDLHPGTHYLAPAVDLIQAPLFVNLRYIDNLYRLPGRNFKLSLVSLWPELFNYQGEFDPANYSGEHYASGNDMDRITQSDREKTKEWLDRARKRKGYSAPYKYNQVGSLKESVFFNANNSYFKDMIALLATHQVDVKFFYLPDYNTTYPPLRDIYSQHAELINLGYDFYARPEVWADLGHLNSKGTQVATEQLTQALVSYYNAN